jgi:hypothetical protein
LELSTQISFDLVDVRAFESELIERLFKFMFAAVDQASCIPDTCVDCSSIFLSTYSTLIITPE